MCNHAGTSRAIPTAAERSTQSSLGPNQPKDEDVQPMKVQIVIPSQSELQPFIANKLKHTGATTIAETMTRGIKNTLAESFKLGIQAAKTGIKSAFKRYLKMT